jgi:branched-chain amino acid transport system substrate-binding protein
MNPVIELASEKGAKTIAMLAKDDVFPLAVAKGITKKAAELGMDIVYDEKLPLDAQDFSSAITQMKKADADVVIFLGYLDDTIAFTRQAGEQRLTADMIAETTGPEYPDFTKALKDDANLIYGYSLWSPGLKFEAGELFESPQAFADAWQEKFGDPVSPQAAGAVGAGEVLGAALEEAGSTEPQAVREALATIEVNTVYGPYKADEAGRNVGRGTTAIQVQEGKQVVVYPSDVASADPVYPMPK